MQDVFYIEEIEQATALLKPMRVEILRRLDEPRTCPQLAGFFGESAQKIYYHIKALEQVGLVEKTDERRVRGAVEGHYQAAAKSYWLAPSLVGQIGGEQVAENQSNLRLLLSMTEDVQADLGKLGRLVDIEIPSLGLSAQIELTDAATRSAFMKDVQNAFQGLAEKYGAATDVASDTEMYRLALMVYPKNQTD